MSRVLTVNLIKIGVKYMEHNTNADLIGLTLNAVIGNLPMFINLDELRAMDQNGLLDAPMSEQQYSLAVLDLCPANPLTVQYMREHVADKIRYLDMNLPPSKRWTRVGMGPRHMARYLTGRAEAEDYEWVGLPLGSVGYLANMLDKIFSCGESVAYLWNIATGTNLGLALARLRGLSYRGWIDEYVDLTDSSGCNVRTTPRQLLMDYGSADSEVAVDWSTHPSTQIDAHIEAFLVARDRLLETTLAEEYHLGWDIPNTRELISGKEIAEIGVLMDNCLSDRLASYLPSDIFHLLLVGTDNAPEHYCLVALCRTRIEKGAEPHYYITEVEDGYRELPDASNPNYETYLNIEAKVSGAH